jgi:hypothetical protein
MAALVVLYSASVHVFREVEQGMIDAGPAEEDIQFVNLSIMTCKYSSFDGRVVLLQVELII